MDQWLLGTKSGWRHCGPRCHFHFAGPDLENGPGTHPFGMCLDYQKAFDSADHDLGIEVLRRLAFPRCIVNLISHQWEHKRRISFADNISETPVTHARGLPQGDPWSPIILALLLVLPMRRQMRLFPGTVPYLFLDDRTLASQTLNDLLAARDCWEELSTVSRMKTQPNKNSVLGQNACCLSYPSDCRACAPIYCECLRRELWDVRTCRK